ncbi:HU family DNA-binding protein [Bacteroides sp. UBA939]|uniref:HU family DNA-binding protein n=1 Tax=Bacteroides sp. UBA939 TaxID=1946092 RepID=UPI0025BD33E7|nr:HU family DNA-binding protein [Bacteroides sp. UBA939]
MNEKLNIQNLIELLAEKHGMDRKNADNFVKEFFLLIEESLENDNYVKIKGLGTFKLIDVESRESVNVNTGERFEIQGHTKVSFTPEPTLKDLINKPFSYFETVVLNDETVFDDTPVEKEEIEEEKERETTGEQSGEIPVIIPENTAETIEIAEKPEEVIDPESSIPDEKTPVYLTESADLPADSDITPEPVVQETKPSGSPVTPPIHKKTDDSSAVKYYIGIVVLITSLCIGAVLFMYYPDWFDGLFFNSNRQTETVADAKDENPESTVALTDSSIKKDTATAMKEDTVAEVATTKPVATQKKKPTPFEPDSVNYKIVGTKATYTIKEGETLTRVALRFYGTKTLWPYIAKHNPGVIKNPDNVPYGTVIKIPELVKK